MFVERFRRQEEYSQISTLLPPPPQTSAAPARDCLIVKQYKDSAGVWHAILKNPSGSNIEERYALTEWGSNRQRRKIERKARKLGYTRLVGNKDLHLGESIFQNLIREYKLERKDT